VRLDEWQQLRPPNSEAVEAHKAELLVWQDDWHDMCCGEELAEDEGEKQ
jgi:hypothetical protein